MTPIRPAPRARVIAGTNMGLPAFVTADPNITESAAGDRDIMSLIDRLTLTARVRRFVTHRHQTVPPA